MQKTLEGWEKYLSSYLGHIRLLSEISLDEADVNGLLGFIRDLIRTNGIGKSTKELVTNFPVSFVTCMAAFSALNQEMGFWDAFAASIGIKNKHQLYNHAWHTKFLEITKKYGFPEINYPGGDKYVTSIRIHGGIPAYSLPDYFEYLLLPSIEKREYRDLPPEEIIQQTIAGEIRFYGDQTILNFFEFSGEIGIDYFKSSQAMARAFKRSGFYEPEEGSNLPQYVIDRFEEFVELGEEHRFGISKPQISFDPYTKYFYLKFPRFTIPPEIIKEDLYWIATYEVDESCIIIPIKLRKQGTTIVSCEAEFQISHTTDFFTVEIGFGEEDEELDIYKKWRLPFFPEKGKTPLVVFGNIDTEPTYQRLRQKLPAESLLLIIPEDCNVVIDGPEDCIWNYEGLGGDYSDWKVGGWDFSSSSYIRIKQSHSYPWQPIAIKTKLPQIKLISESILQQDVSRFDNPLITSGVPKLCFPFKIDNEKLERWKISIRTIGIGFPDLSTNFTLKDYQFELVQKEHGAEIDLSHFFEDEAAFGTYQVEVNGPYGYWQEVNFRLWPGITLFDFPKEIKNHSTGGTQFTIKSEADFICTAQLGDESVIAHVSACEYEISVPSGSEHVNLYLVRKLDNELIIRVPLTIAIPGAKWLIGGVKTRDREQNLWRSQTISIPVDALVQSEYPSLQLKVVGMDVDCESCQLRLLDPLETDKQIQTIYPQKRSIGGQILYFDLAAIKNTLMESIDISIFQLIIEITNQGKESKSMIPLVNLKRNLEVSDVELEIGDDLVHTLTWKEEYILKNRRILLWSVWQPWAEPVEEIIPDGDVCTHIIRNVSFPKDNYYRAFFFTALPWEEKMENIPETGSFDLKMIDSDKKIKAINEKLARQKTDDFSLHFILACIYDGDKFDQQRDNEIKWCLANLSQTSLAMMLAFYKWLERIDLNTQKAIALKMRKKLIMQQAFSLDEKNPIRREYVDIISTIKTNNNKIEIAWMLINFSNNPRLEMQSFELLVENNDEKIVSEILNWIDAGKMNNANAVDLLSKNALFSIIHLEGFKLQRTLAKILISKLIDVCEDEIGYIKPGFRVFTECGSGLILEIQDNEKNPISMKRTIDLSGFLIVNLHDKISGEIIDIDLVNNQIYFRDAEKLYECTKCHEFVSQYKDMVANNHNRINHDGLGPSFRIIRGNVFPIYDEITYAPIEPDPV